jgi:septation ring formation regulator EzrA
MKDIIGNNKQNILLIIVIVMVAWNIFTIGGVKTDVKSYKKQIETIQKGVDSAQVVNKIIDDKVNKVNENVTIITKEVSTIDNNLTNLKKTTNEKVNTVNKFSNVELEFFFTNRYDQNNLTK